jgi:hypothetical protein
VLATLSLKKIFCQLQGAGKAALAQEKAAEKVKKAQEVAALLEEEEQQATASKVTKQKKKKDENLSMLDAALASVPKSKAEKERERKKKDLEMKKKKDEEARQAKAARLKAEEDTRKAALAKGIVLNHGDELMATKISNRLNDDEGAGDNSGISARMNRLSTKDEKANSNAEDPENNKQETIFGVKV